MSGEDSASNDADALGGILSVIGDGGAQGTNKYGLLLVLIDLAQETEIGDAIRLELLAQRTLALYWPMSLPFPDRTDRLQQIRTSNRSLAALTAVEELRASGGLAAKVKWSSAQSRLQDLGLLDEAVRQVGYDLWRNPIARVQKLPGSDSDFLFTKAENPKRIHLRPSAHAALIRHGPLLREVVQHRFVSFVSAIPRNDLTHGAVSIFQYLFPAELRLMPSKAMADSLLDIQDGISPYSGKHVEARQVDHVIPWSRVQLSIIENFAVIRSDENLAKSDHLLAPDSLDRWVRWHTACRTQLEELAAKYRWVSDEAAHRRVLQLQYNAMRPGDVIWDVAGVRPASGADVRDCLTVLGH